ncbi:DNA-binding transcription factor yap1 [Coemansia pectinata]|uniref:DNA-binding transcription factor yap1 n=1 Tax=Coemansia pectinata TaxID=1052879 RepID=A0A9W8GY49_9FUNG|nr:DNA-binding transcription factor yap1 [Coemansia pectinata]
MSTVDVAIAGVTPQKRATSTDGSEDSHDDMYQEDDLHDEKKFKKPGRKPILTEASTKRTAQNRAAQRAFRERKQQYLKGLEEKVKELTEQQERTERENAQLKQCVDQLKEENVTLKSSGTQFTYENVPSSVDFDQAITDLFESSNVPGGLNLTGSYDLQQAALRGTDLTKPGAMDAIQPRRDGASPQSVPTLYPNFDLSSTSGLIQRSSGAMLADHDPLLGMVSSGLTAGFSNDMLSGIQMLASNQNISTGSFMDHLFDSPGMGSSSMVPTVSPGGMHSASRSSQLASSTTRYGDRDSLSPSVSTTAMTPGDMFVPLSTVSGGSSAGSIFGMDSFQGQNGFAQLASFMQQQSSSPVSSQNPTLTPSLSELFTLSPSHISNDGLIGFIPPALTTATAGNALTAGMFSMANTGPAVSLPSLLQQSAAYQAPQPAKATAVADTNMLINGGRSSSPMLPARLMAYRNPDPLLAADDGDQLEKLLLNSMYPVKATSPVEDAQPAALGEVLCTCRSCDQTSCPKHGSPGDMSEEMRDMAPQLLNFVCNETNTMADEELNDLCSLMYKHAKCSDIQKRVEMVREKIKADSELEMFQTKQKLAKQYGLH